jgi:hypothetical protein
VRIKDALQNLTKLNSFDFLIIMYSPRILYYDVEFSLNGLLKDLFKFLLKKDGFEYLSNYGFSMFFIFRSTFNFTEF